jgi:D-tyrosyl-tRNA(Tyr) deacylase
MIVVVQRVTSAEVQVDAAILGKIGEGFLVLLGIEQGDGDPEVALLVRKLVALRGFPGRTPMDRTLQDIQGECLVVSQFTLLGDLHKGNRPSFGPRTPPSPRRSTNVSSSNYAPNTSPPPPGSSARTCGSGWRTTGR